MINCYGYTLPDHPQNPVLTDPPAHRYGIQREGDGRWYYPETDEWKMFCFDPYASALAALEDAKRLRRHGFEVRVAPMR